MDKQTLRQVRGAADLLHDAVDAAATSIEKAQRGAVHRAYTMVASLSHLGGPVRAIEDAQQSMTDAVYEGIRLGNDAAGAAATRILDCLEARAREEEPTDEP
ncbi:MAG: hypothetical protein U0641_09775 [Anaerolineae bacterium]